MHVFFGHSLREVQTRSDTERLNALLNAAVNELNRLQSAVGVFGKYQRRIAQLALIVYQNTVMQLKGSQHGASDDRRHKKRAASNEKTNLTFAVHAYPGR
jgi:hypothetical protein